MSHEPQTTRTFIVHDSENSSAPLVPAGMTAQIVVRPQIGALRPVWLRIDPEIAPYFSIDDVRIGNRSQLPCAQSVPASHFMHRGGLDASQLPLLAFYELAKQWQEARDYKVGDSEAKLAERLESAINALRDQERELNPNDWIDPKSPTNIPRGRPFRCEMIQAAMDFVMFVTNRSQEDRAFCATWECEEIDACAQITGALSDIVHGHGTSRERERALRDQIAGLKHALESAEKMINSLAVCRHGVDQRAMMQNLPPTRANRAVLPMNSANRALPRNVKTTISGELLTGVPFDPERMFVSAAGTPGGATDWAIDDVRIDGVSVQKVPKLSGEHFSTAATPDSARDLIKWRRITRVAEIDLRYIGSNLHGAPFFGSILGTVPADSMTSDRAVGVANVAPAKEPEAPRFDPRETSDGIASVPERAGEVERIVSDPSPGFGWDPYGDE